MVDLDLEPFDFIRLQTVPQDGRTSEEIERRERKNKASRGETGVGPVQSCRALLRLTEKGLLAARRTLTSQTS